MYDEYLGEKGFLEKKWRLKETDRPGRLCNIFSKE